MKKQQQNLEASTRKRQYWFYGFAFCTEMTISLSARNGSLILQTLFQYDM